MSFDSLAPMYRTMEWVLAGGKLQQCRTAMLDRVHDARDVLVAGEGPGRWIEVACSALPLARFTVVDASTGMLELAAAAWHRAGGGSDRIRFVHARLPDFHQGDASAFDLVVTPFFLDCFAPEPLAEVVRGLGDMARPEARWLVCDFRIPVSGLGRARARLALGLAHGFFRATTDVSARRLTDPAPLIRRMGFTVEEEIVTEWGMLAATLWRRGIAVPE